MAPLTEFLDEMAERGWQWGDRDCLLWLGLWSERVTGIDGGAPWRGRYRTALGCVRTLNKSGGMVACIERGAKLSGMVETTTAKPGNVGLIWAMTHKGPREVGAICTGPRWAVLMDEGLKTVRANPIRQWGFV